MSEFWVSMFIILATTWALVNLLKRINAGFLASFGITLLTGYFLHLALEVASR